MRQLHFVKGHCGWDTLSLLLAEQIPPDQQLATALKVLDHPVNGGLEVGLLGPVKPVADIRLRMVDSTARSWISMCGGMTQVIGKALIETSLRERFGIRAASGRLAIKLVTDAGVIPIAVDSEDGTVQAVTTTMDAYAAHLYSMGTRLLMLKGVSVLEVGEFLVMKVAALEAMHPGLDFTRRDPGPHLDVVNEILRAYWAERRSDLGVNAMLYDDRPEGIGQFRVYPRFLGGDETAARLPFEFQCGTGTIAVAIALAHAGELPFSSNAGTVVLEWGSLRSTPDPYGIRTSRVDLKLQRGRIVAASFSHSVIEIIAEGELWLP